MIADLRVTFQMELDLKSLRMYRLHIPQERMAKRLGILQQTISNHLPKMAVLPKLVNTDLSRGFTVPQVAEKACLPRLPRSSGRWYWGRSGRSYWGMDRAYGLVC